MKVLYFHQHFTTPDGSGGTRSYEFARALIAHGHKVTMVCGRHTNARLALSWEPAQRWFRGDVEGIDVISLPLEYSNRAGLMQRAWLFFRFAWRSLLLALREDYDLLFATSTPLTAAVPGIAMRLCGRKKPFVFEVRDLWPELPRALGIRNPLLLGGMSFLEWAGYRSANLCIGLAPGIVEGIKKRAPAGRKVEMIPNGCDLDLFHPSKRARLEMTGVNASDFVAGFTGAHGVANGLDAVLDAAAKLKQRGRADIKLVLIGDGKCKDSLIARASREGLDNCLFFPSTKKTEIARITASFDCGLQILADVPAFYYGTSPNKFFDYISAGIPVITNYPGWLAELIIQHKCGLAVPPRLPDEFADALIRLAENRKLCGTYGRNARLLAENQFDRRDLSLRWTNLLESAGG